MSEMQSSGDMSGTPVWKVTKVSDTFGPASLGGSNRMKRVEYVMANGDKSYVDVPAEQGWPAEAARQIEAAVMDHIDALALESRERV